MKERPWGFILTRYEFICILPFKYLYLHEIPKRSCGMDDVTTLVSGIDFKVRKLVDQTKRLRDDNEQYLNEINQLKKNCEEQKQIIKGLEEKIRILKVARMAEGMQNNSDIKAMVNELVREIDKCIGLLNT
jgi:uncharacterized protein YoxC